MDSKPFREVVGGRDGYRAYRVWGRQVDGRKGVFEASEVCLLF